MNRLWSLTACLLLASATACDRLPFHPEPVVAQEDQTLLTAVAEVGDVRDVVPATGEIVSERAAEIRSERTGVVTAVFVREGDRVKAGQVLARIEASDLVSTQDEARAREASGRASVDQARLRLARAKAELSSRSDLVARGFYSRAAADRLENEVEQAQAELDRAEAEATAASARVRIAGAQARAIEVRAPLNGVVTLARARAGLRVTPDDDTPLFYTQDGGRDLTLEILIPEADLGRVDLESRVTFTVDAYPQLRNDARLSSIGKAPIRLGRFTYYRALATFDNVAGTILPGMTASVELTRADSASVIRIPARAVYYRPIGYMPPITPEALERERKRYGGDMNLVRAATGGEEFGRLLKQGKRLVFVIKDGKPMRREIRIGAQTDEFVEVSEGLRPGEVVVVARRRPDGA